MAVDGKIRSPPFLSHFAPSSSSIIRLSSAQMDEDILFMSSFLFLQYCVLILDLEVCVITSDLDLDLVMTAAFDAFL